MQTETQPVGDLSSLPRPDRWFWIEEIQALDALIQMGCPEPNTMRDIIRYRREILAGELRERELLTRLINDAVHFQLRARSDREQGDIVIEQWVPYVNGWLISGRFLIDATSSQIITELQKGDPRRTSAADTLADTRDAAATRRAQIDATSTLKVLDAVADIPSERLDEFMAVEQALHTGETITSRGDDRRTLDLLESRTRDAAANGDSEAQLVLARGVQDNRMCHNPGDNPLVR